MDAEPGRRTLVSADSHVIEPTSIWSGLLPDDYWRTEAEEFSQRPGGYDPGARTAEMDQDGVAAEVLYPSLALRLFGLDDPEVQRSCFRRYNIWLAEYCGACPERLIGVGLVPAYDMDAALAEISWCEGHGMRGVQLWQTPPSHLPFSSDHYDPLWEACAGSGLSVSLHILTGFDSPLELRAWDTAVVFEYLISRKLMAAQNTLLELVLSGVLDRHRDLRIVIVENECGWLPFFVDQADYYYRRFEARIPARLERPPSAALAEQLYVTFFRDPYASTVAERLGSANLMWSSDYPHANSTWPDSQQVVADRLGTLPASAAYDVACGNACRVFGIDPPEGTPSGASSSTSGLDGGV